LHPTVILFIYDVLKKISSGGAKIIIFSAPKTYKNKPLPQKLCMLSSEGGEAK
jgi:hypothetical protein